MIASFLCEEEEEKMVGTKISPASPPSHFFPLIFESGKEKSYG